MYDYNGLVKKLNVLHGYVDYSVKGDAAFADVVAEVAHARVDATEDSEALEATSNDLFVAQMDNLGLRADLQIANEKVEKMEGQLAAAAALLAISAVALMVSADELERLEGENALLKFIAGY